MNDSQLDVLRALDPARPADARAHTRPEAQAMLARVLEAPAAPDAALPGYAAAPGSAVRRRRRGWRLAGLVGAAAALATAAVVLPSLGERSAEAWTAVPQPVSEPEALAAVQECLEQWPEVPHDGVVPALAERRGASELVVLSGDGWAAQCLVTDGGVAGALRPPDATPALAPPAAEEARMASGMTMQAGDDGEQVAAVFGELGEDVMAVTVLPRDTEPVHATVANGYFAAFWPVTTPRSGHLDADNLRARVVLRSGEVRDVTLGVG